MNVVAFDFFMSTVSLLVVLFALFVLSTINLRIHLFAILIRLFVFVMLIILYIDLTSKFGRSF